ncbi:MAG: prepilin-type N-terminal cleavage/methylation domain-containing protein [Pseudomonadota bacterium]
MSNIRRVNPASGSAFSLVELSIVLVILGLLVGGILTGKSLIRAAELRAAITESNRLRTSVYTFRDKYFALPGDLANATSFWSQDAGGCPGNNVSSTGPHSTTCDGNGDGMINYNASVSHEPYRAWQHLANAGLIEGSYTGVSNSVTVNSYNSSLTTPNSPASKVNGGFWIIQYQGTAPIASTLLFDGDYGNVLLLPNISSPTNGVGALLKPEEAWNIDTKLDDGKPGTGRVTSAKSAAQANASTGCSNVAYTTAASIAASSEYLLSNDQIACSLIFKLGV